MMVFDITPGLNLRLKGAYNGNELAGCIIYTLPDTFSWNENLDKAVEKMRKKASNESVNLIGEYARKSASHKPQENHIYINELAVKKTFRRKGVAGMLIKNAENEAVNFKNINSACLETTKNLNVEIYKKFGYNISVIFRFMGMRVYQMKKILKPEIRK